MANLVYPHRIGYSKMENDQQDIPVDCLIHITKNFGVSLDDVFYYNEKKSVPNEVEIGDKLVLEKLQLITQLDEEDRNILLKLIEIFVSKKRFKNYLQKNITNL